MRQSQRRKVIGNSSTSRICLAFATPKSQKFKTELRKLNCFLFVFEVNTQELIGFITLFNINSHPMRFQLSQSLGLYSAFFVSRSHTKNMKYL